MERKVKKIKWNMLPLIIAIGFIPMIVHMYVYDAKLGGFDWFVDSGAAQIDFFLYYKSIAIIAIGVVMLIAGVVQWQANKRNMDWERPMICLGVYTVCVIFSALFSNYHYYVLHGSYELFESVFVVLSYIVICLYGWMFVRTEDDVNVTLKGATIGYVIISLIGLFQFMGKDLFRTTLGKILITNPSYRDNLDAITFTFDLGTSYETLYNTNYLGLYHGIVIPILIVLLLFDKNVKCKVLYGLLTIISIVCMLGGNTKSGILAVGITCLVACVILWRFLRKHLWIPGIMLTLFCVFVVLFANRMGGFANLYSAIFKGVDIQDEAYTVKYIDTTDTDVVFGTDTGELHVAYNVDYEQDLVNIWFTDENGDVVESVGYENADYARVPNKEEFSNFVVSPISFDEESTHVGICVAIDGIQWNFTNQIDGTYFYFNPTGKFVKFPQIEKSQLLKTGFFSGRGRIWNLIIPKLKHSLIFGTGANTFPFVFPQDDYIFKNYNDMGGLVDVKAHSFYVQQFVENGLIALLAILALYIWYFAQSLKLYVNLKEFDRLSAIGLGICLGTFTYMIVSIANDSNVNTAPVFWGLLGIGFAVNRIVRNKVVPKTVKSGRNK